MSLQTSTLSNGLRVFTVPLQDTQAISLLVFAKVGSRYERKTINGVSHFIEHLMFKGTTRRPKSLHISQELDGVGAQYNAYTSKEVTCYYVKVNAEHTELAADILGDMLLNSTFAPKEIDRERGTIIEEIKMYEDNPLMAINDLAEVALYGSDHPLGWNIAGPAEVISSISREQIMKYRSTFYQANNLTIVAAGKIPSGFQEMLEKHFRGFAKGKAVPSFVPYTSWSTNPVTIQTRETEQVQLSLGMKAFKYHDKRLPALMVAGNILGGTMSSRLFTEVREKRGLAYRIRASTGAYEDVGAFEVTAGLEKTKVDQALIIIMAELRKMKEKKVTRTELVRAKENIRGSFILDFEDSEEVAAYYGRQALFSKKIETPEQVLAKIAAVTADDIQQVCTQVFRPSTYRLAMIGPFTDDGSWKKILRG